MADFKIGDTVRLKSGGPLMTVTNVERNDSGGQKVWTAWFDKAQKECTAYYENGAVLVADDGGPVIA